MGVGLMEQLINHSPRLGTIIPQRTLELFSENFELGMAEIWKSDGFAAMDIQKM